MLHTLPEGLFMQPAATLLIWRTCYDDDTDLGKVLSALRMTGPREELGIIVRSKPEERKSGVCLEVELNPPSPAKQKRAKLS